MNESQLWLARLCSPLTVTPDACIIQHMDTWILIFYLTFNQPLAPAVITGFASQADCQRTADHLHQTDTRLAPVMISVCVPARIANK